jgi:hypothetical protein
MIKINGESIRNQVSEFTVKDYEFVSAKLNNKHLDNIEKYLAIFEYLGADMTYVNNLQFEAFKQLIIDFNQQDKTEFPTIEEVEINGYTYKASTEIKVKDLKHIEKVFKQEKYISNLLAILFKRTDLSDTEHYTKAHLQLKAKLFREQPATLCIPYLMAVGQTFQKQYEKTIELEANND